MTRIRPMFGWVRRVFSRRRSSTKRGVTSTVRMRERKALNTQRRCTICSTTFTVSDKFVCKYCWKAFCSEHRLPEQHACEGDPRSLPAEYRLVDQRSRT